MPTINTQLKIVVANGMRAAGGSSKTIQALLKHPGINRSIPQVVSRTKSMKVKGEEPPSPATLQNVLDGAKIGLDMASQISKVLYDRSKHLKIFINPNQKPDLFEAGKLLFGQKFDGNITFPMYVGLLQYMSDLGVGLEQATSPV